MTPSIDAFVDPLNPRGWVFEPARRRLAVAFPDVEWRVRPVGMVESWAAYEGPEVEGGRQLLPATCARLSEQYGMPIDEYLWFDDPPETSWPACRAVSAAAIQGEALGARALRACREATFLRRRSVSDPDQLRTVLAGVPGLDADDASAAVEDGRADEAFADHRAAAAAADAPGVRRVGERVALPTLVVRDGDEARGASGLAGYDAYRDAVVAVTGLEPAREAPGVEALLERFSPCGWLSPVEVAAIRGENEATAVDRLRELVDDGLAVEETFAASPCFRLAADIDGTGGAAGDVAGDEAG